MSSAGSGLRSRTSSSSSRAASNVCNGPSCEVLSHFPVVPLVGLHGLGNQLPPHRPAMPSPAPIAAPARNTARSSRLRARAGSRSGCTHTCSGNPTLSSRSNRRSTRRDSPPPLRFRMTAVNTGRSWNATKIGSRKNTGEQCRGGTLRHQAQRDDHQHGRRPSMPSPPSGARARAAQPPATAPLQRRTHRGSPRTYPGSQWSTSQIHTRTAIRPISGRRRIAGDADEVPPRSTRRSSGDRVVHANPGSCAASPRRRRLRDR